MTKAQEVVRNAKIEKLREELKPGGTLWTKLLHVSRSGMYRVIDVFVIRDNVPLRFSWTVAEATGFRYDKRHEGVGVSGRGMDMGFHIVSTLSRVLYPDGFGCLGLRCPSNDHSNGDRDYTPDEINFAAGSDVHTHWHRGADYAFNQRWF